MAFVTSLLPVVEEDMNLEVMKEFDTDRAMERFTSVEFQNLLNQEYNSAFFKMEIDSAPAKQLARDLENYIERVGGSN